MKKFLPIFAVPVLALAILSAASFGGFWDKYRPVITWTPPEIEEEQFPGTAKVLTAIFTSKKDLENVKFWMTPPLKRYAVVEPESIDKVEKNKEYTVQIIVSLPSNILSKTYRELDLDNDIKGLDKELKDYLGENKDLKEYLKKFLTKRIPGLLFVTSEETVPWFKFWHREKEHKIRVVHPKALRIMIKVKEPTAEIIPEKTTLPTFDRIEEDPAVGQNYIKDEIIVKFKDGTSEAIIKQIVKDIDGVFIGFFEELGIYQLQVTVADFDELDQKINQLEQNINVEFAGRQVITIPTLEF